VSYKIEATEVEKVAVDHMTNVGIASKAAAVPVAAGAGSASSGSVASGSATGSADKALTAAAAAIVAESPCESPRLHVAATLVLCHRLIASSLARAVVQALQTQQSALLMLKERLAVVQTYLRRLQAGSLPMDRSLLRRVSAVASGVPVTDAPSFDAAEDKVSEGRIAVTPATATAAPRAGHCRPQELADSLLITYIAALTRGSHALGELVDKVAVAGAGGKLGEEGGGGGGGGGGGMRVGTRGSGGGAGRR